MPHLKLTLISTAVAVAAALTQAACLHGTHQKFPTVDNPTAGIFLDPGSEFLLPKGTQERALPPAGLHLTKRSEGFRGHLYDDAAKYCTIGYGHLIQKAPCNGHEPEEFLHDITEPTGSEILTNDMTLARRAVLSMVRVDLSDGQYSALCDFVFNVGGTQFRNSTLLKAVNKGRQDQVPIQFRRWVVAGGKELPALKTRREREISLYFEGQLIPKGIPPAGEDLSPIDIRVGEVHN